VTRLVRLLIVMLLERGASPKEIAHRAGIKPDRIYKAKGRLDNARRRMSKNSTK
jgi:DNA-binding CsgD family transcriptional regulator